MTEPNGDRRTQILFREVNTRIREVSGSLWADGRSEYLCECEREDCTATVVMTPDEFDGLSGTRDRLALALEHKGSLGRHRVVAEHDGFLVVTVEGFTAQELA
jgi:hypothetical protein